MQKLLADKVEESTQVLLFANNNLKLQDLGLVTENNFETDFIRNHVRHPWETIVLMRICLLKFQFESNRSTFFRWTAYRDICPVSHCMRSNLQDCSLKMISQNLFMKLAAADEINQKYATDDSIITKVHFPSFLRKNKMKSSHNLGKYS